MIFRSDLLEILGFISIEHNNFRETLCDKSQKGVFVSYFLSLHILINNKHLMIYFKHVNNYPFSEIWLQETF